MSVIEIPLKNSEEVLEVSLSDLHENSNEILNILHQEEAPLSLYLNFAVNINWTFTYYTLYILKKRKK